jgi:hypothetical protein
MPRISSGIEKSRKDARTERDNKYQAYKDIVDNVLKLNGFSPEIIKIAESIKKITNQASPTNNSPVPDKNRFLYLIYQNVGFNVGFDEFKRSLAKNDEPNDEKLLFCKFLSDQYDKNLNTPSVYSR